MEKCACDSMLHLQPLGHRFEILTPRPFGLGRKLLEGIDPHVQDHVYCGKYGWRSHKSFVSQVARKTERCSHAWITGTDIASLRACATLKLPTVLAHHFTHGEGFHNVARWKLFYKLGCRNVRLITYPTQFTRNEAARLAPSLRSKMEVVRYHFDTPISPDEKDTEKMAARKYLGLPQDRLIIGNAGWLVKRKRWDVFLAVAAAVVAKRKDALFVVCGGGPEEAALRAFVKNSGLEEHVIFTGWKENVSDYLTAFDIMLFNSDADTMPRAPCEAAGHGCVVVASLLQGGLDEFITHEENGFLIRNHDVNKLADAIHRVAGDADLREKWRSAAAITLKDKFSIGKSIELYNAFFSS